MDQRCLVLSGRLLDGQDAASVQTRLASAFGMEMTGFRERVFERAPLIIRRGLDEATAEAQAAQLRGMGVEADVLPDSDRLAWLRRGGQIRGPLPEDALGRYAEPGDQWCHDGGQTWFDWSPTVAHEVPPLPEGDPDLAASMDVEPPPLPAVPTLPLPPPAPAVKSPMSTAAIVALLFGLLALFYRPLSPVAILLAITTLVYLYRRPLLRGRAFAVAALVLGGVAFAMWMQRPAMPVAQPYVPRPLKPLTAGTEEAREAPTQCAAKAAAPKNDEDRFLLTGQRLLTGRAQRKGDTYVAEAAVSVNAECQPNALQLYVFRHGVFIGPALSTAASLATTRLSDFDLTDDQHLRVTLAQCSDKPDDCAATSVKQIAVMPGGGGWTLGEIK
ncbi:MAG TPA: DUF4190 domain-containing protein [Dyella sp.]|uniref:DUF4190 domain-containing protein n=1 Tax=Dyella sp. TaxID=1869338 RepID=UPI002D777600|nr:DUF4190 domain-containing protein [Dyella sp.]HET6551899.1 DUF4190 domain-containing protein [Dyella sp.]